MSIDMTITPGGYLRRFASRVGNPVRGVKAVVTTLALILVCGTAVAATNVLQNISYSSLPGDKVQIELSLSGPAANPNSFTIDNPARIALDLPNTSLGLVHKSQTIGVGVARSIRAVSAGGRTRIVLNLVKMVPYETHIDGNRIFVTLAGNTIERKAQTGVSVDKQLHESARASANTIDKIDFRRGPNGEGRIIVKLSNPAIPVDMREKGKDIVVDFVSATLPKKLERRLDVTDFATPVRTVDSFAKDDNVRIQIAADPNNEHLAYQTGDTFTIEVKPVSKEEKEKQKKDKFGYSGQRLSLNFQSIEVRAVLQLLADFTGLNIVTSDTVQGNVTLRLKNVPWDQALDIILKTKGLGMRKVGNVIMIAPAEEIAAREKLEAESKKQIEALAPLQSESIQVNYAKAADLAKLLEAKDNSMLSKRGSVAIDERTNKLLVRDSADNLDKIRALIHELDVPVRQVLIESRVVLAQDNFSKELGARFGVTKVNGDVTSGNSTSTSGNLNATTQIYNGQTITAPDRWNVNLPVTTMASTAGSLGLAIAKLPLGTLVELELSAAQAEGKSETVSSPRVITSNQKEATIESGTEIPYQQASSSGATTVSFKKAVLKLKVTPQITPDNRIIMDLSVNKDSPDYERAVLGVPPINTQNVSTQVLVDNGQTVVLGGIYEHTESHKVDRIPFFGSLPLVGALFRNKYDQNNKSELLIFVTPKIVKESTNLN